MRVELRNAPGINDVVLTDMTEDTREVSIGFLVSVTQPSDVWQIKYPNGEVRRFWGYELIARWTAPLPRPGDIESTQAYLDANIWDRSNWSTIGEFTDHDCDVALKRLQNTSL